MDNIQDNIKSNSASIHPIDEIVSKHDFNLSERLEENEKIFELLLRIVTKNSEKDYNCYRSLFLNDTYFQQILQLENGINDGVFYFLSLILKHVQHNCFDNELSRQIWNYDSVFQKQIVPNSNNYFPVFALSAGDYSGSATVRYKRFVCNQLLFASYNEVQVQRSISDQNEAKIQSVLNEIELEILNHLVLVDLGLVSNDGEHLPPFTDSKLIVESSLLPFIVGQEENLQCISALAIYLFNRTGLLSDVFTGFYWVFGTVLMNLHQFIRQFSMESRSYEVFLRSLFQLMSIKSTQSACKYPVVALITKLPNWVMEFITDARGKEFESLTYLGPFLSPSVFADDDSEIAAKYFKDDKMHEAEAQNRQNLLQSRLNIIWDLQFQIIKLILVEKTTHDIGVKYLTIALCINKTRGSMQPDESIASGEGFVNNICAVLQRLVAPIKLDKVDMDDLTVNMCLEDEFSLGNLLSDETRIFVDKSSLLSEHNRLISERTNAEPSNFHTECFYLTALGHRYGILATIRKQNRRVSAIQSLERNINEITRIIEQSQLTPAQLKINKATLDRYKSMVSHQKRAILCSEVILFQETYLRSSLDFFIQVAQIITITLNHDISTLCSPLVNVSSSFSCMPQFLLDDMADFLLFLISKKPQIFSFINKLQELLSFIIFISTHSHLVKSPYLVSKFVEVIFSFLPNVNNDLSLNSIFRIFFNHYTVTSGFLTSRLIQFYIDVEKTGASSEFYDKFSIRFRISIIFRTLWHKDNRMKIHLLNEVENNLEQFVKFINRAMNDMVYLLDESITALKRIRTNQEKKNDTEHWSKLSRQEQVAVLQQLSHDERITKSQLTLAEVTVEMLYFFTKEIKDPFLCPELVDKLAAMLNSFLLELVGPKCRDLKVNEPEKYNWDPKKLLLNLVGIYLNLDSTELVEAISNEERFYSNELFTSAISKLSTYNIISQHEIEHFDVFRQKIEALVLERREEEQDFDDVPLEYLDPIMNIIMKEPVMLPQSRTIVDKSVIKRHLLNDDCDPFNRQPLKIEDVIPQSELQREIQEWKKQKEMRKRNP